MKIIVNSNVHYKKPVAFLLKSLLDAGFKDFRDVALVVSQSPSQKPPHVTNARELHEDYPDVELCKHAISTIARRAQAAIRSIGR